MRAERRTACGWAKTNNFFLIFLTEKWFKATYKNNEVCVGATGNAFGVFAIPFLGTIKTIKFVHISGGVAWAGGPEFEGRWGDKATEVFELHITNTLNQRVAPPVGYPLNNEYNLQYELPGQTFTDPQMIFPDFTPFLPVTKGQEFRVWFGEDLMNYFDDDNTGRTCFNIYILFAKRVP